MAVSYVSVNNAAGQNNGSTGTGTASITPTMPASTVDNQSRVFVISVATGTQPAYDANWTEIFRNTVIGSGAVSAGGGQRYMSAYYRDKASGWSTIPAVALDSASAPSHWVGAVAVNKTSTAYTWDTPTFTTAGSDFGTANTAHSATTGSLTTHNTGLLIIGTVQNDNVTNTVPALAQTGGAFGSVTERCDGGTATGNDVAGSLHTCSVTTGAAAALTFTATLSAASQGGTIVIEQTETAPTTNVVNHRLLFAGTDNAAAVGTHTFDANLGTVTSGELLAIAAAATKAPASATPLWAITKQAGTATISAISTIDDTGQAVADKAYVGLLYTTVTASGTLTLRFDDNLDTYGIGVFVIAITGHNTGTPIAGLIKNNNTAIDGAVSLTLSATPTASDLVLGFVNHDINAGAGKGVTPGSDFTELAEAGTDTDFIGAQVQFRTGSTSTTVSWVDVRDATAPTTFSTAAGAFIVKAAATAAAAVKRISINQAVNRASAY